jgi:hypothetical protein
MIHWLKLIGSGKKPITEYPFYGNYNLDYVGFRKANRPSVRMGDHLFLYAAGGSKRIFALAEAVGDPEHDPKYDPREEGGCRWKLNVRYLINLPVDSGVHIDEITTPKRLLTESVQTKSHIKLHPEEWELAYKKLQRK